MLSSEQCKKYIDQMLIGDTFYLKKVDTNDFKGYKVLISANRIERVEDEEIPPQEDETPEYIVKDICNPDGTPLSNTSSAEWIFSDGKEHTLKFEVPPFGGEAIWIDENYYFSDGPDRNNKETTVLYIDDAVEEDKYYAYRKYIVKHSEDSEGNWVNGRWSDWTVDTGDYYSDVAEGISVNKFLPTTNKWKINANTQTVYVPGNINDNVIIFRNLIDGTGLPPQPYVAIIKREWIEDTSDETDSNISKTTIYIDGVAQEPVAITGSLRDWFVENDYVQSNTWKKNITKIEIGSVESIEHALTYCRTLQEVSFVDNTITQIDDIAFSGCVELQSITLPESITSIGISSFSGCIKLQNIELPNTLTSILDSAFSGCTNLTNVKFSTSLSKIGNTAFNACTNLQNIELPNSLITIGNGAFSKCNSLTEITLPSSIETIGTSCFDTCQNVTSIDLSNCASLYEIPASMCFNNTNLKTIKLSNTTTIIEAHAFGRCLKLESVDFTTTNLQFIKEYAFESCSELESVKLPASINDIGISPNVFTRCSKLQTIIIPGISKEDMKEIITDTTKCIFGPYVSAWPKIETVNITCKNNEELQINIQNGSYTIA